MHNTSSDLRTKYISLIDGKPNEQIIQDFIEENSQLVPREFVQNHGIHCDLVLRKVTFGSDYKTDFFYLSKSSDDWNAVFIEIEKPSSRFFKGKTTELHSDFNKGVGQIKKWKSWMSIEGNQKTFLNSINALRVPARMAQNPTKNKYVLVIGRRQEYEGNEQRRRLVESYEDSDFKIITFDSLAEALDSKRELYIAAKRNEFVEILSHDVVDAGLFAWVEPTQLQVSQRLLSKLKHGPRSNQHKILDDGKFVEALTYAADRVRVSK
jgi:Domain of unknown function (DUF4263)